MNRSMCGLVGLTVTAALWSCNGDPTGDIRGEGGQVIADPTTVVVDLGSQEFVTVQQVDGQGNQQAVDFTVRDIGPGITVEEDTTYLQTTIGTHIPTSQRFVVSGTELVNSAFTVETGGDTLRIPVTVAPVEVAPAFSIPAPAFNEPVTVTAPAGYTFLSGAFITFGADTAVVLSRAADGTSFTFVPQPIFPDPTEVPPTPKYRTGTIDSVQANYIPGVPLELPTSDSILVPLLDTVAGTTSPSTAPVIPVPALGETSVIFDAAGFEGADVTDWGGTGVQYYKFTLTEPASLNITLNWPTSSAADLDLVLCTDPTCTPENINIVAAGASHPESGDYNLAAGTYVIAAEWFLGTEPPLPPDLPTRISVVMTRTN